MSGLVVVVGAGLAGLQAATDLVAAGRDVVVLEARDRVGGRVWSHTFDNGQWCERGAEFVDTSHTRVLDLAARLGLRLNEVRAGGDDAVRLLDMGGRSTPCTMHHSLAGEEARWLAAMDELADRAGDVLGAGPLSSPDAAALDARPLAEVLAGLDLSLVARVAIGRDIRTEYMVGPTEVSQLMAGWMRALHRVSGDGQEAHRIVGGNDQLATGLAAALGSRVELDTPVVRIDERSGEVILGSGDVLLADAVVAAVPLPVLGRLWPAMPAPLAAVGYGVGGKVSIQYQRRVWADEGWDGSVRTERSWGELWETSDDQPGDSGVLTALLSSHDGAALVALPDTEQRIVDEIDRIFPGTKGLAGARVRTDWTDDPASLGAYATFGPGQLGGAWPLLQAAHGRLVLAGEHTSPWAGYMEGALHSGSRAAASVLAGATEGGTSR